MGYGAAAVFWGFWSQACLDGFGLRYIAQTQREELVARSPCNPVVLSRGLVLRNGEARKSPNVENDIPRGMGKYSCVFVELWCGGQRLGCVCGAGKCLECEVRGVVRLTDPSVSCYISLFPRPVLGSERAGTSRDVGMTRSRPHTAQLSASVPLYPTHPVK